MAIERFMEKAAENHQNVSDLAAKQSANTGSWVGFGAGSLANSAINSIRKRPNYLGLPILIGSTVAGHYAGKEIGKDKVNKIYEQYSDPKEREKALVNYAGNTGAIKGVPKGALIGGLVSVPVAAGVGGALGAHGASKAMRTSDEAKAMKYWVKGLNNASKAGVGIALGGTALGAYLGAKHNRDKRKKEMQVHYLADKHAFEVEKFMEKVAEVKVTDENLDDQIKKGYHTSGKILGAYLGSNVGLAGGLGAMGLLMSKGKSDTVAAAAALGALAAGTALGYKIGDKKVNDEEIDKGIAKLTPKERKEQVYLMNKLREYPYPSMPIENYVDAKILRPYTGQ